MNKQISSRTKKDKLSIKYKSGQQIVGFEVQEAKIMSDLQLVVYQLKHRKTNARFAYIDKDDSNSTFSVAFKTIPEDSSGVAHILEHVVLCGSKKFPVRDPFFSMIKRSLQNFMNAFTANDWTMYPFSTVNRKDFFNLLDVYLDSAFFPLLSRKMFLQEGWRVELSDNTKLQSSFIPKGVVFNEMKGALSSEQDLLARRLIPELFPSNTYRHNSGGDPVDILSLTWKQLKDFHKKYYHPSNAWFYYYGKIELTEICSYLEEKLLTKFSAVDIEAEVPCEPSFEQQRLKRYKYPSNDPAKSKHQFVLSWVTGDVVSIDETLLLQVLSAVLLNNSGAPLRKALIESKLGSNLSDIVGLNDDLRQTFFSIGLKGVDKADVPKVEPFIKETLKNIFKQGIEQTLIDSALHQLELEIRKLDSGSYPQGLQLLASFVGPWLHGADFVSGLDFAQRIKSLKKKLKDRGFLPRLINEKLLNNSHCLAFEFYPDENYLADQQKLIDQKIRQLQRTSSAQDRMRIQKEALTLEQDQFTKEDLSILPKVSLDEIDVKEEKIASRDISKYFANSKTEPKITIYDQPTNGIVYLEVAYPLGDFDSSKYHLLPTLGLLLTGAGTKKTKYDQLAIEMAQHTGGIVAQPKSFEIFSKNGKKYVGLSFSTHCLTDKLAKATDILAELITEVSFNDQSRIEDLLKQRAVSLYNNLLPNGHSYAGSSAMKGLDRLAEIEDKFSGISQIQTAISLSQDNNRQQLVSELQQAANQILSNQPELIAVCPKDQHSSVKSNLTKLAERIAISASQKKSQQKSSESKLDIVNDIWLTATPVSYVAKAYKVAKIFEEDSPRFMVLTSLLRGEYLHRAIREQGGAYGAMAGYDAEKGILLMLSYRDPHLQRTWQYFDQALQWAADGRFSSEELESAILQTFSRLDKPKSPHQKAFNDYYRGKTGISKKYWDEFRKSLIATTHRDIVDAVRNWSKFANAKAAISSSEKWEQETKKISGGKFRLANI